MSSSIDQSNMMTDHHPQTIPVQYPQLYHLTGYSLPDIPNLSPSPAPNTTPDILELPRQLSAADSSTSKNFIPRQPLRQPYRILPYPSLLATKARRQLHARTSTTVPPSLSLLFFLPRRLIVIVIVSRGCDPLSPSSTLVFLPGEGREKRRRTTLICMNE